MRPRFDRKIAGVCAGVAEYFDLDVTLVRVVWLITAVITGIGRFPIPLRGSSCRKNLRWLKFPLAIKP